MDLPYTLVPQKYVYQRRRQWGCWGCQSTPGILPKTQVEISDLENKLKADVAQVDTDNSSFKYSTRAIFQWFKKGKNLLEKLYVTSKIDSSLHLLVERCVEGRNFAVLWYDGKNIFPHFEYYA